MNFLQSTHTVQLKTVVDGGTASTASGYLDTRYAAGEIELEIPFGAFTSCDSTANIILTVEASTSASSNATEVAIPFKYRYNTTLGNDSMTSLAEATSAGVTLTPATDLSNPIYLLYVDPAKVAEQGDDFRFIRVVFTCDNVLSFFHCVNARFVDRYSAEAHLSST